MALRTLELCAGYGGIGIGLRLAREDARTVCYVEREITAAGILAARFEDGSLEPAPIWSDLKTFDGRAWRGRVDCVVAGYPCQPFSVAGKRLGAKDPRHLWPDVARIVREVEPEWCFFENVGGHLRLGFFEVAKSLRRMGYAVAAGLFTAAEIGAPHRRERLFILAHAGGERRQQKRGSASRHESENAGGRSENDYLAKRTLEDLANAGDRLVSQSRRGSQERTGARPAVAELADGALRRRGVVRESSGGFGLLDGGRAELADAEYMQHARRSEARGLHRARASNQASGHGVLFPPGPDDLEAWGEVLARTPEIEPAICGSADGLTARVDRLRALGNGVVPLVAGYAYVRLMAAHGLAIEPESECEMKAAA